MARPRAVTFTTRSASTTTTTCRRYSFCVLSDSGTIAEESSLLGFPAVTLRDSIERPEALDTASILMTDLDPDNVVEAVRFVTSDLPETEVPADYQIGDCARRTVNFILSTHRRYESWSGVRAQETTAL